MDPSFYPLYASRADIEGEIKFMEEMVQSLKPEEDQYTVIKNHYEQTLGGLYGRLAQYPSASTSYQQYAAPSPGESSASESRKRSREESNAVSLATTPGGGSPGTPMSVEYPGYQSAVPPRSVKYEVPADADFVDLTMDEPVMPFLQGTDPFPDLVHAYQPGQIAQPVDAFNQEWLTEEALARFLVAPTPAGGAYAYGNDVANPLAVPSLAIPSVAPAYPAVTPFPIRNPRLEEELFGDDFGDDSDPTGASNPEAVQDLIENIRHQDDLQPEAREQTPKAMCSILMEHQKIALTWLLKMERGKSKGSILADEMGLGKTVEALSLILANPSTTPACKTTLIVAPVALMRQWEKELARHVHPRHQLRVYVYHGNGKNADFDKLRTYDVVLTTFGTLASEMKLKEARKVAEAEQCKQQDVQFKRRKREMLSLLGQKSTWYRVILDEAQCIKNRNTLTSKASNDLQARHRLCMTGTPMMNSIDELFPLIRFLKIAPYNVWGRFSYDISKPLKTNKEGPRNRAMGRVQAVLKSIMLRRGKTTLVDGKQICEIPPKHTNLQPVEFSDAEYELYKAIETNSQLQLNKYLQRGTVNNNYANVLVMLLRLRQLCCHPHLIKDLGVQASTEGIAEDTLLDRAKFLADDVVKRLTETDSFECPICYETDANPTIIIPCGHTTCGECFQKLIDPSRAVREGNESGGAKCPHCRGILSSEKITDFQHFCKIYCPGKLKEMGYGNSESPEPEENSDSDSDTESDSDESDGDDGSLKDFVVSDSEEIEDDVDMLFSNEAGPSKTTDQKEHNEKNKANAKVKAKGKGKAKAKSTTVTLAQLKKESLRNAAAKRKYLKRLRKTWTSSAKIEKTLELLSNIRATDPTEKTLVFSQFTALLDLLEVPLLDQGIKYQRYDGSMQMDRRAEAVNRFMDNADENIMLVSLKAGNAGLNLSKASQVIMLDPFWNPFVEEQAVDRAHRMPQKREVHVHRVLVPETVEDRICALQDKKRELINTALDEGVSKSLTRLSIGELQYLFGLRERD
ncbi:hypothetical protein K458DRAFT_423835 [Lentithecium fluviatile CBS 122367]|uniref:SWI/SNF family DNA-dependent ATPase Ris1 n=1 Tax=Lentithecium fluviatile CBS 122367 TaxID=1168545 RepID=A0A6G1II51_9PLEO|nr:hypothetical protein K458DRAFT_423835 [Lentithecium fluviatile CBS 122367]